MKAVDLARSDWEKFVARHAEANFLQDWRWGELHQSLGFQVVRRGVYGNDQLVGVWQGIVKNAKRGRYLEVPAGPLIDWTDQTLAEFVTKDMKSIAQQTKSVFVRVRPQLDDGQDNRQLFRQLGFRQSPMHLHAEHTNILDLADDEDEILAKMRRQTRYEVRRADKQGIVVEVLSGRQAIQQFHQTQQDTAKRQGFIPSSLEFLEALADKFGDDLRIYQSKVDDKLLNQALVIWSGEEADYYEASSTIDARSYAGAYGLVWRSIRDAKQAGKSRYNFWGIAYNNDPKHRYAGVTTFKRGFGGQDAIYLPAHDLVLSGRYLLNWLVEMVRKKMRRL